jgi:5-methylcytosine-specific restriction endonuclease McrA
MGSYYKFKIFGIPVGIRVGCIHKRFPSWEEAEALISDGNSVVKRCPFCKGFHIENRAPTQRERISRDQNGLCLHCKKYFGLDLTIHHVIPVAKGGRNNLENLQGLCRACHTKHHQKDRSLGKRRMNWNPEYKNTVMKDKLIEAGVISEVSLSNLD